MVPAVMKLVGKLLNPTDETSAPIDAKAEEPRQ